MSDEFLLLVEKAINSDSTAFAEICASKGKLVIYLCKNLMQGQEDAEDAAQEVFIQMQKSIKNLRAPEAFNVWLNSIVFNTCQNLRRGKMKKDNTLCFNDLSESFIEESLDSLPHKCLESTEMQQHILAVIDSLPENYRLSIQMFYYEDMGYSEIAQVLGTTNDAVTGYLRRAKSLIRLEIEDKIPQKSWGVAPMIGTGLAFKELFQNSIDNVVTTQMLEKCLTAAGVAAMGGTAVVTAGVAGIGKIATTIALIIGGAASVGLTANEIISSALLKNTEGTAQSSFFEEASTSISGYSSTAFALEDYIFAMTGRVIMHNPGTPDPYASEGLADLKLELVQNEAPYKTIESTKTLGGSSNGYYMFTGLKAGDYRMRIHIPDGCTVVQANGVSATIEDEKLGTSWVTVNGETIFSLEGSEVNTLTLPDIQLKGNTIISGNMLMQSDKLSKMPLVRATLKDPQNRTVAVVTSNEKGRYAFIGSMISQQGIYTVTYELEKQSGFKLLNSVHNIKLAPGESMVLPKCTIIDVEPPSISIKLTGGNCDCGHENPRLVELLVLDNAPVNASWSIVQYIGGAVIASSTNSEEINAAVQALPNGDYYINAAATDATGNNASANIFISILVVK